MLVSLQLVGLARAPLKPTVLLPCEEPNAVPVMVTGTPGLPEFGERLDMAGGVGTVKFTLLLATPLYVVTMTGFEPGVTPDGTVAEIAVSVQLDTDAQIPLNVTLP
ncbi:MAG TPA: hypothetical protein VNM47_19410 [Terriglobia bacterium]|nr:hypothetical protein [Terriglobia bacterium]